MSTSSEKILLEQHRRRAESQAARCIGTLFLALPGKVDQDRAYFLQRPDLFVDPPNLTFGEVAPELAGGKVQGVG